ncbi:MAG: hypothetical protein ACREIT_11290 [Tepidisphaeraceae bacterium]
MPTLPLYTPHPNNGSADAWHAVTAPGGYEWWYFDAEHATRDVQLVGILFDGFVFHPGYLRAYDRYASRPTRCSPPVPSEYRCVYFAVYENGRRTEQFLTQFPASAFEASRAEPRVRLGPNELSPMPDGSMRLRLDGEGWEPTALGPRLTGRRSTADLTFTPRVAQAPIERTFLSREMTGAEHRWIIANPLCDVTGSIRRADGSTLDFVGRGYHDHNFGTGPIGPGVRRWMRGRILSADRATTFRLAYPLRRSMPVEAHLVTADATGVVDRNVCAIDADWSSRTPLALSYPRRITIEHDTPLQLTNPRLVEGSPFYLRLVYDALDDGRSGRAFCEVAYPHRLRWPVLGRMIEMSIDKQLWARG